MCILAWYLDWWPLKWNASQLQYSLYAYARPDSLEYVMLMCYTMQHHWTSIYKPNLYYISSLTYTIGNPQPQYIHVPYVIARYSASELDLVTMDCFFVFQDTRFHLAWYSSLSLTSSLFLSCPNCTSLGFFSLMTMSWIRNSLSWQLFEIF